MSIFTYFADKKQQKLRDTEEKAQTEMLQKQQMGKMTDWGKVYDDVHHLLGEIHSDIEDCKRKRDALSESFVDKYQHAVDQTRELLNMLSVIGEQTGILGSHSLASKNEEEAAVS